MQSIRPVGPGTEGDGLSQLLDELRSAILELQTPQSPGSLPSVLFAALPPAANWTGAQVWVSDKAKVGVSNGTAWTDTIGGAL